MGPSAWISYTGDTITEKLNFISEQNVIDKLWVSFQT
jgi:hypothetical protein